MKNNLGQSYILYLKNIFNFSGRTRRSDFWQVYILNYVISLVIGVSSMLAVEMDIIAGFLILLSLIINLSEISLLVRSFHDIGTSGLYCLLNYIPYIGFIFLLVYCTKDSCAGSNKYGPNPKESLDNKVGSQIYNSEDDKNRCKICGAEISEKDEFCPQCGSNLTGENYYG